MKHNHNSGKQKRWKSAIRFRNLLINNGIHENYFAFVVETVKKQGLLLKKGTVVDSTIIEAPPFTKNNDKQRGFIIIIGVSPPHD